MSDIIRLLPDAIANQIAAGEVIQRPASVVKELLENAVDAGATRIQLLVKEAGRALVRVIDNGKGMSETDARMAFERHATSKIADASDLFDLHTFGFRGEALASIVAVAQVELITRRPGDDTACALQIEASRFVAVDTVSAPVGTDLRVKNLFFNVPARRRFLKSNETELRNITVELERVALIYPQVEFEFFHNDLPLYHYRSSSFRQRIVDIYGRTFDQSLLAVHLDTSVVHVEGYITTPKAARKRGACNYLFVNGRFMKHPYFHKAILAGYDRMIESDETPSYFLHLEVDPHAIDVNIHPTKTEIKFEDEKAIWQMLHAMVREALSKSAAVPLLDFNREESFDIPIFHAQPVRPVPPPKVAIDRQYNPFQELSSEISSLLPPEPKHACAFPVGEELLPPSALSSVLPSSALPPSVLPEPQEERAAFFSPEFDESRSTFYQCKGRYIIGTITSGLMIVDQHRAHVRILYESKLGQMRQKSREAQQLLFPEMIDCSAQEKMILEAILDDVQLLGFDLSFLGGFSYSINAVPSGVEISSAEPLLRQIISDAVESGCEVQEEIHERVALAYAQRAAIASDKPLSQEEMQHLVAALFTTSSPNFSPDGKPILTILSDQELRSRFS